MPRKLKPPNGAMDGDQLLAIIKARTYPIDMIRLARIGFSWRFKTEYVSIRSGESYNLHSIVAFYSDSRDVPHGWFYYQESDDDYGSSPNIALLRLDAHKYAGGEVTILRAN